MLTTYPQNLEKVYIKYIQKQNNVCHVKDIQQILTETLLLTKLMLFLLTLNLHSLTLDKSISSLGCSSSVCYIKSLFVH